MKKKPGEIVGELNQLDQKLLNEILSIEKSRLHIDEVKNNSRVEKEIVTEIMAVIDRVVKNED